MARSKKKPTVMSVVIFLCSMLALTGCKDTERKEAVAEAAAAKAELTKIKANLASIISERDNLKSELATVVGARDKLQAAVDQAASMKEQLSKLTGERDTAIAKATEAQGIVEELKSQLAEQMQKITGLEGQNKKLQETIDELKKNLGGEVEIPSIPKL